MRAVTRSELDAGFTAIALMYGHPRESDVADFFVAIRQVFGIDLVWQATSEEMMEWITAYKRWYAREERAAIQSSNS